MYARRVEGQDLTFDFAEGLLKNNLLFVDRETNSVWSQLHGKAVMGPKEGTPLTIVPSMQTTWKFWRETHPDTQVMMLDGEGRPYLYRNRGPGTPPPAQRAPTHDTSSLGLGLVVGGQAIFFPFRELRRNRTSVKIELSGKEIAVFYREGALTAWAEDENGDLLASVLAYEEGWLDFYPESRIFRTK